MPPLAALYGSKYHSGTTDRIARSAETVVPLVVEWVEPRSVVDVGCGAGTWLHAFMRHGVDDVLGIEGPWGRPDLAAHQSLLANLGQPIDLERRFDLAISLEVAEHLPESSATTFVDSLTRLSDVVLFSAAIPGQGGTNHVNEQWPSYWCERFAARGYTAHDVVRPVIWTDDSVAPWYRQNMLLFVATARATVMPGLDHPARCAMPALDVAHPIHFATHMPTLREMPRLLASRLRGELRVRARLQAAVDELIKRSRLGSHRS